MGEEVRPKHPRKRDDLFSNYTEQRDFELWAFGNSSVSYDLALMHTWNSRHGAVVWLVHDEGINDSLKKMVEVWKGLSNEGKEE